MRFPLTTRSRVKVYRRKSIHSMEVHPGRVTERINKFEIDRPKGSGKQVLLLDGLEECVRFPKPKWYWDGLVSR